MKFVKIAAVASVAAMVAGGAFATTANTDLEAALIEIEAAYDAFGADQDSDVTNTLGTILYMADNHGAVKNVDFNALTADSDDGSYTIPDLTIEFFDFSGDAESDGNIHNVITTLKTEINDDFFGSGNGYGEVVLSETAGVWSAGGASTGHVKNFINNDGLAAALTEVQSKVNVDAFDGAAIDAINTAIGTVATETEEATGLVAAVAEFNSAAETLNTAQAETWSVSTATDADGVAILAGSTHVYADREGVTDKTLNGSAVLSAVSAADYVSIVDAYITEDAAASN